jgi:hypothetical protein
MAVGLPLKTTYADGDVYSASDVNDTNGTINITAAPFAAGKNKIINGDFRFNQRSFTSNTTAGTYNFDRWLQQNSGGTFTVTPQAFTPGTAPVSGYEATNFLRGITASQSAAGDYAYLLQRIEDVRTLAGSTAVVSFWAKANTGTPKIGIELCQNFGAGGSPSTQVNTALGSITLSTSWARYSISVSVPSISGKTIGTTANTSFLELNLWTSSGSTFAPRASSIGIQNFTADIWGVQVEQASIATAFQTATGTIQGELAACQRYYWRTSATNAFSAHGIGGFASAILVNINLNHPVPMRVSPTSLDYSSVTVYTFADTNFAVTSLTFSSVVSSSLITRVGAAVTGGTGNTGAVLTNNNTTAGYVGLNAEL